jgi:anti-sigma regulatory factor (Ser/Thr protein kinase)
LSEPDATFRSSFPADRAAPSIARHAISEFLHGNGADPRALADVLLALSEVVTNSVVHGYRGMAGGEVAIEAKQWSDRLMLSVADRGGGMAPRHDSPGLGLGLPLVGRIAQRVDISSPIGGGTLVSMCFMLSEPAA